MSANPVTAAVGFLTWPGRAQKILAAHKAGPDGRCQGCWVSSPVWPCSVADMAQRALRRVEMQGRAE